MVAPPSKFYIVSTLLFHKYRGVNFEVMNCISLFSMFVLTKATVKLAKGNTAHAQTVGIIYVIFLIIPLYIKWSHFNIVQVTLLTPYHQVPSNLMLVFKRFCLNLLNIVALLTLRVIIGWWNSIPEQRL